ncbi:hypothetical protein ACIP5N_27580 [Streptomyces sp. NPDC088768]|uniref:hypothetical protein n=1 Tax=Streptomyces sp. NPDC088768 TaxID=3365894 RepID=UPI0038131192
MCIPNQYVSLERIQSRRELPRVVSVYTRICEELGRRMGTRPRPWLRVLVRGTETAQMLAVIPRRYNPRTGRYEETGGEWVVTDDPRAEAAWLTRLAILRLTEQRTG